MCAHTAVTSVRQEMWVPGMMLRWDPVAGRREGWGITGMRQADGTTLSSLERAEHRLCTEGASEDHAWNKTEPGSRGGTPGAPTSAQLWERCGGKAVCGQSLESHSTDSRAEGSLNAGVGLRSLSKALGGSGGPAPGLRGRGLRSAVHAPR